MTIRRCAACGLALLLALACADPPPEPAAEPASPAPLDTPHSAPPRALLPDGTAIILELAETAEEQTGGLMYRATLPEDQGMLFLFPAPTYPGVWMKDTWVSLDIVFLDQAGQVVQVEAEVPPCRDEPCPQYLPSLPAMAVLELAAGVAARHGVEPGAAIRFENLAGYP